MDHAAQQVGGALGLAVLVTIFGSATRSAGAAGGATHAFVYGADRAFIASSVLIAVAALLASRIGATRGGDSPDLANMDEELAERESALAESL